MNIKEGSAALLDALDDEVPFKLLELVERDVRSLQGCVANAVVCITLTPLLYAAECR